MVKIVRKNQKGVAHLILIIVVIVAAIAAVGFLAIKGKGTSLETPSLPGITQRATEADFSFVEDPNLKKHFVAQANQTKYRTKTYSEAADLNFVNEVEIKGENFNTRDIEQSAGGEERKHTIQIGDTTYVKDYSDSAWWKQTLKPMEVTPGEEPKEEPTDFKTEYSKPDLQFKFLGKESCGNMTCFKYEQTTGGPEGMAFSRIFWFDDKQYLLRKEETAVGEFGTKVEYSYDNINISPPSPTKDVPAGKSIYDYQFTTPNSENSGEPVDYGQDSSEEDAQKLLDQYGY